MKGNNSPRNKPTIEAMFEEQQLCQLLCAQMEAAIQHLEQFNTHVKEILALTHQVKALSRFTKNNISLQ